jgi:hypothetical protein
MRMRRGQIALILLIPVALYGLAKGFLYYKTKQAADEVVAAAAGHAEVQYSGIETDLFGGVTVKGISVKPHGIDTAVTVDAVRLRTDDLMFLFGGIDWQPGSDAPPTHLAIEFQGVAIPLDEALLSLQSTPGVAGSVIEEASCEQGLNLSPGQLRAIGFESMHVDISSYYRIDESAATLSAGFDMALRDMQSISADMTFEGVDLAAIEAGVPPQLNLGSLRMVIDVDPEFGRQLLKTCAVGTDLSVDEWSAVLAERSLQGFEAEGLKLGNGLANAVRQFHREWGAFSIEARPAKPVGLLSLVFLPPDQLASLLGLHMRLNGVPIADTSFEFEQPDAGVPAGLGALFGAQPSDEPDAGQAPQRPERILVRRQYETIPVSAIDRYVDRPVRIKPRSQPLREGILKGVADGEAEVEQRLHGGKFTAYVSLDEIEQFEALIERRIAPE